MGQFYLDRDDLIETLVPFFAAGLRANERCIWVTAQPLCAADAREELAAVVNDLATREAAGQIEIIDAQEWYLRNGDLGLDAVIQSWLDAEVAAREAGYNALRISGNTYWLPMERWYSFAEYEARAHAAFRGRRIVALCSYSLSTCGTTEIVDVLRNHTCSLVRNDRGWEVVHGATAALATVEPAARSRARSKQAHSVQFYRNAFPAASIAESVASALAVGKAAACLVTREHQAQISRALLACHVDAHEEIRHGRLTFIDADAVFAEAWTRPGLDENVLSARVLAPIRAAIERFGACWAAGELVNLFAGNHDRDGAVLLERWWNTQLAGNMIELACFYGMQSFDDTTSIEDFHHVCDEHAMVAVDATPTGSEVDRLRAELAQMTVTLSQEITRRRAVETAYASARNAREQLVLLHRLTAYLGEITTRAQLIDLLQSTVMHALEADGIALVTLDPEGEASTLVSEGLGSSALPAAVNFASRLSVWSNEPGRLASAAPGVEAFAATPLIVGESTIGVLVVGFADPQEFRTSYRALMEDVARQLALALDRATGYERLQQERERAESASRAKDEFLAMLGHELRNPLAPILTATQLMGLRGDGVFEKERTVIERQVQHMIRLVDDLLDVSRITRGKIELRRRPVEVAEVVSQAIELVSPAMEERHHVLTLDVPKFGIIVHVDSQRLTQVITNLLTNAARYTPNGGRIHLSVHAHDSAVRISVKDNGIGIDDTLLLNVFDLFVQGRQASDRANGGLGLGLAIAKTLVTLHGGKIEAHSAGRGQGSEFTVELPRYANARPSRSNLSGAVAVIASKPRRVLVVDDNEDAAFLFSEALKRLGHEVEVAHDGPSALAAARKRPPDIAFLDIGLPVMDGYELGRRLCELGVQTASSPPRLIAMTGYGQSSDRTKSHEAGFALHLVKPIDIATVQDALTKLE